MVRTVTKKANGNIKRNVAVLGVEVEVGHQEDEANHQEGEAGHREDEKVVAALLVEEGVAHIMVVVVVGVDVMVGVAITEEEMIRTKVLDIKVLE
jgi:hypothetical protein